ncbi:MAG: hypothetical protein LBJ86_07185 [Spirochaetaceae bacterium]|jgi:uncharacterized membrane protein|nr:hypothetical protein [Spirochaetaceae bacterium]
MSAQHRPAKKTDNLEVRLEQRAIFSGPLPPPETLKGYGSIDLQYPERIFKMAEAYSDADVRGRNTESLAIILGMTFSFLSCIGGLGACLALALKGMTAESITAAVAGISPIVINALSNFKISSK